MGRPTLAVADITRQAGNRFVERNRAHLAWPQLEVLRALERCQTAALGGDWDRCSRCGHRAMVSTIINLGQAKKRSEAITIGVWPLPITQERSPESRFPQLIIPWS
jgi:hypothetical protein